MVDTLADIFTAAREGRNPRPEMVGEELAKVRAELRDLYAQWEALEAVKTGPIEPPSGPAWEYLAIRAAGALPGLLATIAMLVDALGRIIYDEATATERKASPWMGTGRREYDDMLDIAAFARLLAGTEED